LRRDFKGGAGVAEGSAGTGLEPALQQVQRRRRQPLANARPQDQPRRFTDTDQDVPGKLDLSESAGCCLNDVLLNQRHAFSERVARSLADQPGVAFEDADDADRLRQDRRRREQVRDAEQQIPEKYLGEPQRRLLRWPLAH
jgi:hypothetical protein